MTRQTPVYHRHRLWTYIIELIAEFLWLIGAVICVIVDPILQGRHLKKERESDEERLADD